jgi:1-acyl-sn-glycerol-3-phosphate acyltransferase
MTPEAPPDQPRSLMWKFCQGIAGILARVAWDLKVRGTEHMPPRGGVLVVSNHQSYIDPVVLTVMFRRRFAYLADAYLFKIKPFAWLISSLNAFPIQTGKGDIGAMKETIRLLQSGEVLNLYPEGTRSRDGTLQPVLGGAALAIRRAKVPVMPAIIVGAYEAYPRHAILPRAGRVRVIFDKPVELHHLKADEIVAFLEQTFARLYAQATAWRDADADGDGEARSRGRDPLS